MIFLSSKTPSKPSWWDVIVSVIAALFGVQSERNRKRDFEHANPIPYIVVGVVLVTFSVIVMLTLVSWIVN